MNSILGRGLPDRFESFGDMLASPSRYAAGAGVVAGGFGYVAAAANATDHHVTTAKSKLYSADALIAGRFDPRAFGWEDGGDLAPYLTAWWASGVGEFYLPPGTSATLASAVTLDVAGQLQDRSIVLRGVVITHTDAAARILITDTNIPPVGVNKFIRVLGGTTYLLGDASVAWHVQDVRNVRFEDHHVWGNTVNSPSRGCAWLLENRRTYTERTKIIRCGSFNTRHLVRFHMSGGQGGGLSFKGTIIRDCTVSGGVAGDVLIAITTDVTGYLQVTNASQFVLGETVTQAATGATGVVLGYPEDNSVIFLGSVSGTFTTAATVTGGTSGQTRTPTNVGAKRFPNIYGCIVEGTVGNVTAGSIFMDLNGGMRDTYIGQNDLEAPATAYWFRTENNWTTERPVIELSHLQANMQAFYMTAPYAAPTAYTSIARRFLGGLQLIPHDVQPQATDGVLAFPDGVGWNPAGVGSGNGGRGLFFRLASAWRRVALVNLATQAQLADAAHAINTSDKFLGKTVTTTDTYRSYVAQGAAATSKWRPSYASDASADVTPVAP